jgi:hypothetical protein
MIMGRKMEWEVIQRGYQPEIAASDNKMFTRRRTGAAWSPEAGLLDVVQEV